MRASARESRDGSSRQLWSRFSAGAMRGASGGASAITTPELREWLSYIASDELQGRTAFSEGVGLAGGYMADHLRAWGVKPAGDHGQYLQAVHVLGVKTTSHASIMVTVGGVSKTFADGGGITFPNMGGTRTPTIDHVEPARDNKGARAGRLTR